MAKTPKTIALVDPALPKVEVKLGDKSYFLCFTFGALALAEAKLREIGQSVNLLMSLDFASIDATRLVPLFFASLITHQSDITPDAACTLITLRNMGVIYEGLANAYMASIAEPEKDAETAPLEQPE